MSSSRACQLPKSTRERLAACEAVGLHYWADHPAGRHVRAIDGHQQAHVVRIHREDGTGQHVCRSTIPTAVEERAGDDEAVPYQPPGAA
jgi:hypothetical protein